MSKPDPKELTIIHWSKEWSNKAHEFINHKWVVAHGEKILCQGIPEYPYIIYEPIKWVRFQECLDWVNTGCIADIQEGLTNLNILFTEKQVKLTRM
jgi:hypothetical protein